MASPKPEGSKVDIEATNSMKQDVMEMKGLHGPYNKLQTPLPYFNVLPEVAPHLAHKKSSSGKAPQLERNESAFASRINDLTADDEEPAQRQPGRALEESELIALPFKPPSIWHYAWDVLAGTWELVLYVAVMLLAVMMETNLRYFRSGSEFDQWWVMLYKVVVICYPAGVMMVQFMMVVEYAFRKFLFHRLLSVGILVQYAHRPFYRSWFFVFFFFIYIILNVWAWWGLVTWWGFNGASGPEVTSMTVWGIVNIVAFHLMICYIRLLDEEKRLLKPLQAYLLPDVVLVSDESVKHEAWRVLRACLFHSCRPQPTQFDVDWLRKQGVQLRCGYTGSEAHVDAALINNIMTNKGSGGSDTGSGPSAAEEGANSLYAQQQQQQQQLPPVQQGSMARNGSTAAAAAAGGGAVPQLGPGPVAEAAEEAAGATLTAASGSGAAVGAPDAASATAATAAGTTAAGAGAKPGFGKRMSTCCSALAKGWLKFFRVCCCCCCRLFDPRHYHSGMYAWPLAFLGAFWCCRPTWPLRRDVSFLRVVLVSVTISSLVVAGGIVFGGWLVGRTPQVCQWGKNACYDCLLFQEEYVHHDQTCETYGYDISKNWTDPDYFDPSCPGGRAWFSNGVWTNNRTLMPTAAMPHNMTPVANPRVLVDGYLAATMSYYAYADSFEGLQKGFEGQYMKRFRELFTRYGMSSFDFVFIDDTAIQDTQFVITGTPTDLYIIFRGTDGVTDTVLTDLSGRCKDNSDFGEETCVHNGFLSAYRQAGPEVVGSIFRVIANLNTTTSTRVRTSWHPTQGQRFNVWLTGHSLGGALATLFAMDLATKGVIISGVFTYGSPRVGDTRFRDLYMRRNLHNVTWRFVHGADPIPQVPFESMGFKHVRDPIVLNDGRCTAYPEDTCPEDGTFGCGKRVGDHLFPGYFGNLGACIEAVAALPNCTMQMLPIWQLYKGQL